MNWKLLFVAYALSSCAHLQMESEYDRKFMSAEEVKQEFQLAESGKLMMDGPEDEQTKYRKSQLIDLDVFFPADDKKQLNAAKEQKQFMAAEMESYPDEVDLREWDTPVKSQWNGTCTTFSGIAAIEHLLRAPETINLSERDSWNHYGKYSCAEFVKALSKNRVCDERDWPQGNTRPYTSCAENRHAGMIETTFIGDNKYKAMESLSRGKPVYIGMATPKDMLKCYKVIRSLSKEPQGGHALLITGYRRDAEIAGGGYYILKNSWGEDCGDRGYQYLPFGYCEHDSNYCYMWEVKNASSTKVKPKPDPEPKPDPDVKPEPEPRKPRYVCKGWWFWKKCKWIYD